MSEKKEILRWLYRQDLPSTPEPFLDLLSNAAEDVLKKPKQLADAYAQANQKRFWNYLQQELAEDRSLGRSAPFLLINAATKLIQPVDKVYAKGLSFEDRRHLRWLQARSFILSAIDSLDWREFEGLGVVMSHLLGATKTHLTPRGNEGGVDFYALINFRSHSHIFESPIQPIRIVGQCKFHSSDVQVSQVKEFCTTLNHIQNRNPQIEPKVPLWFRESRSLIVGWIISPHGFMSGSITQAADSGIVLSSDRDLAEAASMSTLLSPNSSPAQRAGELVSRCKNAIA